MSPRRPSISQSAPSKPVSSPAVVSDQKLAATKTCCNFSQSGSASLTIGGLSVAAGTLKAMHCQRNAIALALRPMCTKHHRRSYYPNKTDKPRAHEGSSDIAAPLTWADNNVLRNGSNRRDRSRCQIGSQRLGAAIILSGICQVVAFLQRSLGFHMHHWGFRPLNLY